MAELARGRVCRGRLCQGPSLLGAEMSSISLNLIISIVHGVEELYLIVTVGLSNRISKIVYV